MDEKAVTGWAGRLATEMLDRLASNRLPFDFFKIIAESDDKGILELMSGNLDRPDSNALTLLSVVVETDRLDLCRKLLEAGCDPDLTFIGTDPAEVCVQTPNAQSAAMLALLLQYSRFGVRAPHASGSTLLHQAVEFGRMDIVSLLMDRGARLSDRDIDGETVGEVARSVGGDELLDHLRKIEARAVRGRRRGRGIGPRPIRG